MLEYSFFSLCEEVDIFYCLKKETEFLKQPFTEDNIQETMLTLMEGLKSNAPESDKWHAYFRRLYLLSMGEFSPEPAKILKMQAKENPSSNEEKKESVEGDFEELEE